jgi:hypothetical protein
VPVVWSFQDDKIFGEVTRLFGDRQPLEVELVTIAGRNRWTR